jgi:hypothetical protein
VSLKLEEARRDLMRAAFAAKPFVSSEGTLGDRCCNRWPPTWSRPMAPPLAVAAGYRPKRCANEPPSLHASADVVDSTVSQRRP